MDVKGEVLLQLFNKSKLRHGTKTFLEPNFFLFIVRLKKLGFSVLLNNHSTGVIELGPSLTLTWQHASKFCGCNFI